MPKTPIMIFFTKKSLNFSLLLLASVTIIIHLIFIFYGYYFTGDTISYEQYAVSVSRLRPDLVFVAHSNYWPPLTAITFNLLRLLPISFVGQHKIFVWCINFFTLVITYFLTRILTKDKEKRLAVLVMLLLSGLQHFILKSAIPENILIACWLGAIYFLYQFLTSKKSIFILPIIITASLAPLARYAGISVPISISISLVFYWIRSFKSEKYSWFVILAMISLMFIPIGMYVLRNYIQEGSLVSNATEQWLKLGFFGFYWFAHAQVFKDLLLIAPLALITGLLIPWKKNLLTLTTITGLSVITYQLILTNAVQKYYLVEGYQSRFTSPSYPAIILLIILLGSYLKVIPTLNILNHSWVQYCSKTILLTFFCYLVYTATIFSISEKNSTYNFVEGPKFSGQIEKMCKTDLLKNRILFMQTASTNWVAQSLKFYCLPAIQLSEIDKSYYVESDSLIFSPHKLTYDSIKDITPLQPESYFSLDDKGGKVPVYLYTVPGGTDLDVAAEYARLSKQK